MTLSGIRSTLGSLASVTLLALAVQADAAVAAIDPEQQRGNEDLVLRAELLSKVLDQGIVRHDDSAAHIGALGRTLFGQEVPGLRMGLGLQLDAYVALGEDQARVPKNNPGEVVQFNAKASYLLEVLNGDDIPLFQLIPHYEFITYPNVAIRHNYLKWRQHWVGTDFWWMTPLEGFEVGGGADFNVRQEARMFRAAVGMREFYQDAPFDLTAWQLVNFGNREYKRYYAGSGQPAPAPALVDRGGFTTFDIGAKVTMPLPWNEMWTYTQADWVYWLESKDRRNLSTFGQDVGHFVIAIGYEWRPD